MLAHWLLMDTAEDSRLSCGSMIREPASTPSPKPENLQEKSSRLPWLLLGIFAVAVIVRVFAALASGVSKISGDEAEHFGAALNLIHGLGYALVPQQSPDGLPMPTAYRTPGPALLMSLGMLVFGAKAWVGRAISILVSSASVFLVYAITRTVANRRPALGASVACALYPTWVLNSFTLLSEPLFVTSLLLSLWQTIRVREASSTPRALLCGLAWGITVLSKPLGLPCMALAMLYLAWSGWRSSRRLPAKPLMLFALGCAAVYSPWIIRNAITMHRFIPLATEGGESLLGANNPYVLEGPVYYGLWIPPLSIPEYRERLKSVRDEVERSRIQSQIAIDYLKNHPGAAPVLAVRKLLRFLTPITVTGGAARLVVLGSYGVLLLLLAAGVALRDIQRSPSLDIALLWLLTSLVTTAVYWGNLTRGRLPLEIVFLPWGAVAAEAAIARLRERFLLWRPKGI